MFKALRKNKFHKAIASFLLVNFIAQIVMPLQVFALTSGPSQPEIQSFEPIGTNQMVDPFTGDFTYNIPLFNLPGPNGGYPFNMAYHSAGINKEQESSWVGLGWNINVGSINRSLRNVPDEFNENDNIKITQGIRSNWTIGVEGALGVEFVGGDPVKGIASLSSSVFFNNYRGVGMSLGIAIQSQLASGDNNSLNAGLNLNLNSQDGLSITPSISLYSKKEAEDCSVKNTKISVSAGYNSMTGLKDFSLSYNRSSQVYNDKGFLTTKSTSGTGFKYVGSTRSFAGNSGTPSIGSAYIGSNFNFQVKLGINNVGIFGALTLGAFYNRQVLKNNYQSIDYKAYGYMHMDESNNNNNSIRDASRVDDGIVSENSQRLPYPVVNYDVYSLTGQGFASTFRAHKNNTGVITPQYSFSSTGGARFGPEFGVGLTQNIGGNFGINSSEFIVSGWDNYSIKNALDFKGADENNHLYESYYFKAYGELTTNDMVETDDEYTTDINGFLNDNKAGYIKLRQTGNIGSNYNFSVDDKLVTTENRYNINEPTYKGRRPRGTDIRGITVEELIDWPAADGTIKKMIPEYYTEYYKGQKNSWYWDTKDFNKNDLEPFKYRKETPNHVAVFVATSPKGDRYVYGQPAYNYEHVEETKSVAPQSYCTKFVEVPSDDNLVGNKYLMRKELSPYPYAHLLTSVLGSDYVDADDIPGPSDGDYGYWVKFNYALMHSETSGKGFRWRAPFYQGNYIKGLETDTKDDKVVYSYGKKEIWYLATAETSTHLAEFYTRSKLDATAALPNDKINDPDFGIVGADHVPTYKLDSISLFSKSDRYFSNGTRNEDAVAIKTTHFKQEYLLCGNSPNTNATANSAGRKLTLKEVYFTHKNNKRGKLSPYVFEYNNEKDGTTIYDSETDKWGNYRASSPSTCDIEAPYVNQYLDEDIHNQNASTWLLKKINLPSGGDIHIEYEADRYAYVQDQIAMQMTPIAGLGPNANNTITLSKIHNDADKDKRRVYFKLEHPTNNPADLKKYITVDEELYFKTRVEVRNNNFETVSGYAKVEEIGFDTESTGAINNDGLYTHAYVVLHTPVINGDDTERHPFAVTAWNFLRVNNPDYIYKYTANLNSSDQDLHNVEEILAKASALLSIGQTIAQTLIGFYTFMAVKQWANRIDLDNSFIRLRTPDKEKFGGGSRVRKLIMKDNWHNSTNNEENNSTYGTVYDYTIEENGERISSGVAEYEPLIGGDEIALRKPLPYYKELFMKADIGLYDEEPINEELYPGASVGYRQVSAMSLPSYYASLQPEDKNYEQELANVQKYQDVRSLTGKTVYEFYTAKEFPVKTEATELYDRGDNNCTMCKYLSIVPIPFIGMFEKGVLAATQGYSIVLNDMHGKQKRIAQYAQSAEGQFVNDIPVSSVEYMYNRKDNEKNTGDLESKVTVMFADEDGTGPDAKTKIKTIGEERDFWVDMRKSYSKGYSGGVDINTEIFYFFAGLYFWPSYSRSVSESKTLVTNKVVHQSGIQIKTRAQVGESVIVTENKYFDPLTGEPLLTTVTNDFEDPVYEYQMPARWNYEGMGPAYEISGAEISATLDTYSNTVNGVKMRFKNFSTGSLSVMERLTPGAILIMKGDDLYLEYDGGNAFKLRDPIPGDLPAQFGNGRILTLKVIKSAKSNQLQEKSDYIKTVAFDPTTNRDFVVSTTTKVIPPGFVDFLNRALQDGPVGQFESGHNYYFKQTTAECDALNLASNEDCFTEYPSLVTSFPQGIQTGSVSDPDCNGSTTEYNCVSQQGCNGYMSQLWHFSPVGDSKFIHTGIRWFYNKTNSGRDYHSIKGFEQISATEFKVLYEPIGNGCLDQDPEEETICLNENDNFNGGGAFSNYSISVFAQDKVIPHTGEGYSNVLQANHTDYVTLNNGSDGFTPFKNYAYKTKRTQSSSLVNLSRDGTFQSNFYFYNSTINNWQKNSEITMFNNHGKAMEEKDALGNYSAVQYGYNDQLVVATAQNAKQGDIYFTSFEDEAENYTGLTKTEAHLGYKSKEFKATSGGIIPSPVPAFLLINKQFVGGKAYHISARIKGTDGVNIQVTDANGFSTSITEAAVGHEIDGWRRIESVIDATGGSNVILTIISSSFVGYIDDVRVYPEKALMQSYVYNTVDWTLAAKLDENNYATYYYYDEKGALFQVKRETEKGIQTVQETRKHIQE
jgi:hypothetical protein